MNNDTCKECGKPLPADNGWRREYCNAGCRRAMGSRKARWKGPGPFVWEPVYVPKPKPLLRSMRAPTLAEAGEERDPGALTREQGLTGSALPMVRKTAGGPGAE